MTTGTQKTTETWEKERQRGREREINKMKATNDLLITVVWNIPHIYVNQTSPSFALRRDVISETIVCLSKEMSFRGVLPTSPHGFFLSRVPHSSLVIFFLSLDIITIHLGGFVSIGLIIKDNILRQLLPWSTFWSTICEHQRQACDKSDKRPVESWTLFYHSNITYMCLKFCILARDHQ